MASQEDLQARQSELAQEEGSEFDPTALPERDEAFMKAIMEDPENDEIRLAYANLLEKRGDPRGEFIRLQCHLEHLAKDDPTREELKKREAALVQEHGERWFGPITKPLNTMTFDDLAKPKPPAASITLVTRGFISEAWLTWDEFVRNGDNLFQLYPITTLSFVDCMSEEEEAAPFGDEQAAALAQSPHLARLRSLAIIGNEITDIGAKLLAASPHLVQLTSLNLSHGEIGREGAEALAASPYLTRLTALDLRGNSLNEEACATIQARFKDALVEGQHWWRTLPSSRISSM